MLTGTDQASVFYDPMNGSWAGVNAMLGFNPDRTQIKLTTTDCQNAFFFLSVDLIRTLVWAPITIYQADGSFFQIAAQPFSNRLAGGTKLNGCHAHVVILSITDYLKASVITIFHFPIGFIIVNFNHGLSLYLIDVIF